MTADGHSTYGAGTKPRVGFFTDTTVCIGCKACEVACKEWNLVPEDGLRFTGNSYDNTGELNADTWRHVAFIEQTVNDGVRWLMASDVCKHCTHAGCLDVCPTGAIFRTEFGTVVIQDDVCNGCGYCVIACPFGVIGKREGRLASTPPGSGRTPGQSPDVLQAAGASDGLGVIGKGEVSGDGGMHKCTLCYDRLQDGLEPACAKACPTDSIQFGPLDELIERARRRADELHAAGVADARLYGDDPSDGVGGFGAFFLLLDEPEVYGLPPDPKVPTAELGAIWAAAGAAALTLAAGLALAFLGGDD
jgi:formate dehydrogenase iron-sulfur subunit